MRLRYLHEGWTVTDGELTAPATVPGCVHTDLLAAGLIEDPYLDDNEARLAWIGRKRWRYETTFAWSPDPSDRSDLVCEGLDTVATVILNGVEVGTTANMHRSYRFAVRELLREGENTLAVVFDSPYEYAESNRAAMGDRPGPYPQPYPFIRKMACNFGWDWGPTLVTSGIWRPIALHSWATARLAEVRPLVWRDAVFLFVRVERACDEPVVVRADVAGVEAELHLPPGVSHGWLTLPVDNPRLWWPRGYGEQHRYPLTVTLPATGEAWQRQIGFRSVALDTAPDPAGSAFTLRVNDVPVFVRGANWIPDDCFPSRVTRQRLAQRFEQACAANVNLLRVWGGGIYESQDFYELADEHGLLVLQDFLFACAAYPEDEPLAGEIRAEAAEQVSRLMPHPSLVAWIGNNENFMGYADWGWKAQLEGRSWGEAFYLDTLPGIVGELDPSRPYWPGTPYSGDGVLHPNDPGHGTVHIWDVWNELDYHHYAGWRPRFVAEFGFQGPPAYATLRRSSSHQTLIPDSAHQKALGGNEKLLRDLSRRPASFDDWHYLTQLNQARAVAFGIEHFRSLVPHCMGAVMWQLNDCWPVTSWSAIDGDGRRKPLWYAMRRAFADRLLVIRPSFEVVTCNDSSNPWQGELRVWRLNLAGEQLAKDTFDLSVPARRNDCLILPDALRVPTDPAGELLVAELGERRAVSLFAEEAAVAFPPAEYETAVQPVADGYLVTITARSIVRDLALFPDRLDPDAYVDDMLLTLLPGESAAFHVTSSRSLDPRALTTYPVLRCANEERTPG